MTKYEFQGHYRQAAAFTLFAKLGPDTDWAHFLSDCSRGKTKGLHGFGPSLLPVARSGGRPIYDQSDIDAFINDAKLFDPTLGPIKTVTPTRYEMDTAAIHPLIPARMRKVTPCDHMH